MNESRQTTNPPRGATAAIEVNRQSLFHRLATEPFVHFALLSLLRYLAGSSWSSQTEWAAEPDTRVIVIDQRQVDVSGRSVRRHLAAASDGR